MLRLDDSEKADAQPGKGQRNGLEPVWVPESSEKQVVSFESECNEREEGARR